MFLGNNFLLGKNVLVFFVETALSDISIFGGNYSKSPMVP